jgi:hypothetical protein
MFVHAATTITVDADKASGHYSAPISVTLTASDPAAKIWYVFDPNGTPGDALPYSGPIRIEKSTPLLFFAYTDTQNESVIERRDYDIAAPSTLQFRDNAVAIPKTANSVQLAVKNFGAEAVTLSGWVIRTDMETRTLEGSELATGTSKAFVLAYSEGAAILSSPDGEIQSTVPILRQAEVPSAAVAVLKKAHKVAEAPKSAALPIVKKPAETPAPAVTESGTQPVVETSAPAPAPTTNEAVTEIPPRIPSAQDAGPGIKASAAESAPASGNQKTVVLAVLLILAGGTLARIVALAIKKK